MVHETWAAELQPSALFFPFQVLVFVYVYTSFAVLASYERFALRHTKEPFCPAEEVNSDGLRLLALAIGASGP